LDKYREKTALAKILMRGLKAAKKEKTT